MSGYQFIHVQTHALSRSKKSGEKATRPINEILDEVARNPGNMPHVMRPEKPVFAGIDPNELELKIKSMVDEASALTGKKIRKDRRVMMSMVVSYPTPVKELEEGEADFWLVETRKWAKDWANKRGGQLVTIVIHKDEEYPHLHMYILPRPENGMKADDLHPGKEAKARSNAELKGSDLDRRNIVKYGNRAYVKAMREFQDEYYTEVGLKCGLTRIGPAKKRMSRADWVAERDRAAKIGAAVREAESIAENISTRTAEIEAREANIEAREDELKEREANIKAREDNLEAMENIVKAKLSNVEKAFETLRAAAKALKNVFTDIGNMLGLNQNTLNMIWNKLTKVEQANNAAEILMKEAGSQMFVNQKTEDFKASVELLKFLDEKPAPKGRKNDNEFDF